MELNVFLFRILLAMTAGALIGLERQIHHKSAGIRTNALVAVGAAIFVNAFFRWIDDKIKKPTDKENW